MYQILINNVYSQVVPTLPENVVKALRNKLSYEILGAMYARKINPYAGRRFFFSPKMQQFPTGMIHLVRQTFDSTEVSYEYVDQRVPPVLGPEIPFSGVLRDYQEEAVSQALASQRGVVKSSTGSGKSLIIAKLIAKLNVPTILFIHKQEVFFQLISTLEKTLNIPIGKIGASQCEIHKINVAMIQTVARAFDPTLKAEEKDDKLLKEKGDLIRQLVQEAQCLIADETHHLSSDSFWTVYKNATNAFYRYGFSASPWRDDGATIMIEGGTAKQIIDIPASHLIDRNFLCPVTIYLYEIPHERQPKGIKYAQLYDNLIMNNDSRNRIIADLALEAASLNKSVLVAVTKVRHGEILEDLLKKEYPEAIFVHGQSDTNVRQQVWEDLRAKKLKIVIATTIAGEGLDIPSLDVLINAKAGASSVDAFQLVGRVLRTAPNKEQAYVVDLSDDGCRWFGQHSGERLKIYSTEKNYILKFVKNLDEVKFDV